MFGFDCVEEVVILNKVVGLKIGGVEYFVFDVINGWMIIFDSVKSVLDGEIVELVVSIGMIVKFWDVENVLVDQVVYFV